MKATFAVFAAVVLCACPSYGALAPPPGYYAPAGHASPDGKSGETLCPAPPPPHVGALVFRSKYDGSDSARADINPGAVKDYHEQTRAIVDLERGVVRYVMRAMRDGGSHEVDCAVQWLDAWARADALMSTDFNHTGKSMRKWSLGSLASAWLSLKFSVSQPLAAYPRQAQRIESWFARLADQTVKDWSGLPLERVNNHSYWAAWAVMASAVALDRRDLFDWSVERFRVAVGQVDERGFLPNELKRKQRALAYHNYSLPPLTMIAAFAKVNGVDLRGDHDAALRRLAERVMAGIKDHEAFVRETGKKQETNDIQDHADFAWLEPYCALYSCTAKVEGWKRGMQPFRVTRLGGDVTRIFRTNP
ncbi:MAG: mannuronate-specific alginate lyase [Zoogloeaceae bacterium]|nr:mannuronate-specific alginate lyase [Zoogloeaceae bacterium]